MSHLSYVLASYGITVVALAVMIGWIMLDQRAQKAELQRLESQGVRRRSAQKSDKAS